MSKPLLSIGMIVKNESRCLERCLKALQPLRDAIPCQLVIADTGSDDGTQKIAERYADIFFDFPWINDFAAARNAVMDRCIGAWYLSLDADEYIDADVKELIAFLHSDAAKVCTSAFLIINNYSDPNDESQYSPFNASRLLNMSTKLRFEGAIHEVWPSVCMERPIYLENTVLWHDGYIRNGKLTEKKKGKRNMALIEAELEKTPNDLLRVMQALESSYTVEQAVKYAYRAVELLHQGAARAEILGPAIYRDALKVADQNYFPEFKEWLEEAFQRYPDSLYIQVDVQYLATSVAQKDHDYAAVLEHGQAYFLGVQRLERKDTGANGLRAGTINAGSKLHQENMALFMAMAHARQRQWLECRVILEKYPPENLSISNVTKWLNVAFFSWEYIDLTELFRQAGRALYLEDAADKLMEERRKVFTARSVDMFAYVQPVDLEPGEFYPEKAAFPLLVALGDCDLAHFAQIMLAEEQGEIAVAAEQVRDWSGIPLSAMVKVLGAKITIPDQFFRQSVEELHNAAGRVATALGPQLADLLSEETAGVSLMHMRQLWSYDLTIAALRTADWHAGGDKVLLDLCDVYAKRTEQFLTWYYNPGILQEETIDVLPGMHQFGWLYLQAWNARVNGMTIEYIRWLRKALNAAPAMKPMVDRLVADMDQEQLPSTELLTLAEQVRTILAAYAPDDPAVAALKASEAYQKVAYLIEGVEAQPFGGVPQ